MRKLWENPMLSMAVQFEIAKGEIERLSKELAAIDRMKSALVDADHLADTAEIMLGTLNAVAGAQARFDLTDCMADKDALEQAEELQSEYWRAIQSAVYEYRKRAERARAENGDVR